MFEFQIRQEQVTDHDQVDALLREAFGQPEEAILVRKLRAGSAFIPGLSLVAESNGKIVGQILFTSIQINGAKTTSSLALAPMSVLTQYQSNGIGSALVRAGLERCHQMGYRSVIVLGHADYYPRFGFEPASKWHIKAPFEVPDEYFMALELVPGALQDSAGVVVYPSEFGI